MSRRSPVLLIIDPSAESPETEGVREAAGDWPGEVQVLTPVLNRSEMPRPEDGYRFDGVILLGSSVSVHDPLPWIRELSTWVRPILEGTHAIPLLGVCFGHQLIAHLSGGQVGFLQEDRSKRVGVEETTPADGRLLPDMEKLRVVVSHRETVEEVPGGYKITASRPGVAIDALEHKSLPVFSCQFHPEARLEFAARAGIDANEIDGVLRLQSGALLGAFRSLCR